MWSKRITGTFSISRRFAASSLPWPSTMVLFSPQIPIGSENPKDCMEFIIACTSSTSCFLAFRSYGVKSSMGKYSIFKSSILLLSSFNSVSFRGTMKLSACSVRLRSVIPYQIRPGIPLRLDQFPSACIKSLLLSLNTVFRLS